MKFVTQKLEIIIEEEDCKFMIEFDNIFIMKILEK